LEINKAGVAGYTRLWSKLMTGNLQDVEDLLGNMDLTTSPVVLAVKLQIKGDQKIIGVAFADASIREIGVSEFIDNDVYSNFEVLTNDDESDGSH
jgi:DNA mismatch repair protein MSH2